MSESRKIVHTSIIVLVFAFATAIEVEGQVNNDNLLNYEIFAREAFWNKTDCEAGEDDPSVTFSVRDDANGQGDRFMGPFSSGVPFAYDIHIYWEDYAPTSEYVLFDRPAVHSSTSTSATHYDWHMKSWESDDGTNDIWDDGDDCGADKWTRGTIKTNTYPQITLHNTGTLLNDSKLEWYKIWRYTNGDNANTALDFGTINAADGSSVNHTNGYNDFFGFWASSMKYTNQFGNGERDMFYKFTMPTSKNMEITQDNPDMIMYLLDAQQNVIQQGTTNIKDAHGTKTLCAGTYFIVVERGAAATGPPGTDIEGFTLRLTTHDIFTNRGLIENPSATFCEGAEITIPINSVQAPYIATPMGKQSLQWQRNNNDEGWTDIPGATGLSLSESQTGSMPNTAMGNDFVRFRRNLLACGDLKKYGVASTINSLASTIMPGSISLLIQCSGSDVTVPYTIPVSTSPGCFRSLNGTAHGTGVPLPLSYMWEVSKDIGVTWIDQNETSNTWTPDSTVFNTTGEYKIRRTAVNGCGATAFSDTLTIQAILADGSISGKVMSKPGIGGPGGPVSDVLMTAMRVTTTEGGVLTTDSYTAMTNSSGDYVITDLYYGPNNGADFKIVPSKTDEGIVHQFDPPELSGTNAINLKNTFKNRINVNFIDETTFTFAGKVFQDFESTMCGMDGIIISLNGIVIDTTDISGQYSIAIPSSGTYTIEATYSGHTFIQYTDFFIDQDYFNKNFQSFKVQTISGKLTDGCNNFLGEATITIQDSLNCIIKTLTTISGQFSTTLPARPYKIFFSGHSDLQINAFFSIARFSDLSTSDQVLDFIYKAAPVIDIVGLPAASSCPAPYNVPLLDQGIFYPLDIFVYEGNVGGCLLDTGFVLITDQISDRDAEVITLPISNGKVNYSMLPGLPNLIANHIKIITVAAKDTLDQQSAPLEKSGIVLGARPREQTFSTVTPELPLMILRDPPGDKSFSFLEASQSQQTSISFYGLAAGSVNVWSRAQDWN